MMRVSPFLNKITRTLLYWETKGTGKGINFLVHPNELITEEDLHLKTEKRAGNFISYLFADVIRRRLKQRNLGEDAKALFEKEIDYWNNKEYQFKRIKDYDIY